MLSLFAHSNFWLAQRRSWLLAVLPLVFLALSVDEVARIQEWIGERTDILLPGGSRANTPLPETGIWMFVVGVSFLAAFVRLISSIRMYFQDNPNELIKVFAGMLITERCYRVRDITQSRSSRVDVRNTPSLFRGALRNARRHNRALG